MLLRRAKQAAILSLCPSPLPAGEEMLTHKSLVKLSILEKKKKILKRKSILSIKDGSNTNSNGREASEVSLFPPWIGTLHSLCQEWAIRYSPT